MKANYLFFLLWVVMIALIFFGSISPSLAPPGRYHIDKLVHFMANFCVALYPLWLCKKRYYKIYTVILLILCGIIVELIQQNIPGREASMGDVIANSLGVMSAYIVIRRLHKSRNKRVK